MRIAAISRGEAVKQWVLRGNRYWETHCRECGEELNSYDDKVCKRCGGIVCPYCGECFCR